MELGLVYKLGLGLVCKLGWGLVCKMVLVLVCKMVLLLGHRMGQVCRMGLACILGFLGIWLRLHK
jgi:hypothetical protein